MASKSATNLCDPSVMLFDNTDKHRVMTLFLTAVSTDRRHLCVLLNSKRFISLMSTAKSFTSTSRLLALGNSISSWLIGIPVVVLTVTDITDGGDGSVL